MKENIKRPEQAVVVSATSDNKQPTKESGINIVVGGDEEIGRRNF